MDFSPDHEGIGGSATMEGSIGCKCDMIHQPNGANIGRNTVCIVDDVL